MSTSKRLVSRKVTYHHGNLRAALLEAALDLVAREGASSLTLREVARRAGVSHAAPYRHFADKEALLAAVAEEGFRALRDALAARADAAGDDPVARLRAIGIGYVRFAVDHPAHCRVMFGGAVEDPARHLALAEASAAAFAVLVDAIRAAQATGQVRAGDPMDLALAAWSLVHGLALLWIDGALAGRGLATPDPEALASTATLQLFLGLAGPAAPLPPPATPGPPSARR